MKKNLFKKMVGILKQAELSNNDYLVMGVYINLYEEQYGGSVESILYGYVTKEEIERCRDAYVRYYCE